MNGQSPSILYCGALDLQAEVLTAYISSLGYTCQVLDSPTALAAAVRVMPKTFIILAVNESPPALVRLARQLVLDPSSAFPHIFILHTGERFDAQLEAVTVLTGASRLQQLLDHLRVLHRPYYAGA